MAITEKEALSRAMNLCSKSERSLHDIKQLLGRWGISNGEEIDKICNHLIENRFIDENRYARSFVRDKQRFNKWGVIKLRAMLKARGISQTNINDAINSIDREQYESDVKDELVKKRATIKASNQFDQRSRLMRFALSRGYETDLVYKTLNEILNTKS